MKWSDLEIFFLKANAAIGIKPMADALGRSETAVRVKAHELGISLGRGNQPGWSDLDFLMLKAMASFGVHAVSHATKRTLSAIRYRASTLAISLERKNPVQEAIEESAAIMEHDGGWPRESADAMALVCAYCNQPGQHIDCAGQNPEISNCIIVGDRLATEVNLAAYAFSAAGTLDDIQRIDPELHAKFLLQQELWKNAESDDERRDHAGGMVRGYIVLTDRIVRDEENG